MVGGRNFKESRFNRATQARRQPGSAFKPFVYASAIESGISAGAMITDLDSPIDTPQGGWMPEDEHSSAGAMTMRTALRTSSNRAAVRMLNTVGLRQTVDYLNKLHMGDMPQVPSLALGAAEVTLQSLTAGFATFANRGEAPKPILIRRIVDESGNTLAEEKPELTRAFSESTAFIVANMLTDVINAGTAYRARANGFNLPAAGKTGTTNDYVDAWFVGFTPKLVAGVWIGFDQPQTIVSNGYGGELAVPVWADFMKVATKGDKATWLQRPKDVDRRRHLPHVGQAAGRGLQPRRGAEQQRRSAGPLDGLPRILRAEAPSRPRRAICTTPATSSSASRVRSSRAAISRRCRSIRPGCLNTRPRPRRSKKRRSAPKTPPRRRSRRRPTQKNRRRRSGFWGRIFGSRKQEGQREQKPEPRNP